VSGRDDERDASAGGIAWSDAITPQLVRALRKQFALDWYGTHGVAHWIRVRENGLRLAATTGADPVVVELFAFLHGAFALLATACAGHTDGLLSVDPTVGTCWDADRLDLGRTGKRPRAEFLSTAAARDPALIAWAYARSMQHWQD
jgi:uncharacterized protein